ncbi:HD domain-containing protein [Candidatus Peregrinibacteria bacterium]|jgi:hypothetical protein|nr:HD domain-containing protein [Candidatus Peregrinibacteria bacterium]MBT4055716.1 HD domain-containing protein [Candidatus Peregrinibacteria bacterium]
MTEAARENNAVGVAFIDREIDAINDPEYLIDDEFRAACHEVVEAVWGQIDYLELEDHKFGGDQIVVLVNEMYRTYRLHKNHYRKDKTSHYFYSHIVGSMLRGINVLGLVGLRSLLAILKHDDPEDHSRSSEEREKFYATLFDVASYKHRFEDPEGAKTTENVVKLISSVRSMVTAVTKIQELPRDEKKERVYESLLEEIRQSVRVAYVKIADRLHNMETIHGHENPKREAEIAQETLDIYMQLAELFGMVGAARFLFDSSVAVLNEDLFHEYLSLQDERYEASVVSYKDKIESTLRIGVKGRHVKKVLFSKLGMEKYAEPGDTDYKSKKLEDLNISPWSNMHEIVVLVDDRGSVHDLVSHIKSAFGSDDPDSKSSKEDEFRNGVVVRLFNPKYGGSLVFRVFDVVSEKRSKRGELANFAANAGELNFDSVDKVSEDINERIGRLLDRRKDGFLPQDIFEASREVFLSPYITVYYQDGRKLKLPKGATPLDFAATVDPEVLIGFQRCYVTQDPSLNNASERKFHESLEDGDYVKVETCMSGDPEKFTEEVKNVCVEPWWLAFCKTADAIDLMNTYLRGSFVDGFVYDKRDAVDYGRLKNWRDTDVPDIDSVAEKGREYVKGLCTMFNVDEDTFRTAVLRLRPSADIFKFYYEVGSGEFNPVLLFAEDVVKESAWSVEVLLEDRPESLDEFFDLFRDIGFNKDEIAHEKAASYDSLSDGSSVRHDGYTVKFNRTDSKYIDTYAFFKRLLKAQRCLGYSVRLVGNPPRLGAKDT